MNILTKNPLVFWIERSDEMVNSVGKDINDYGSVGDYVYAEIRRQIISWDLKPGQRISEAEMSKALEVSRTPVREGFIRLKNEGLVEILSQRGTLISKIDLKKVRDSAFVRNCLEREVIREISGRMKEVYQEKCRAYLKKQEEYLNNRDYIKFHKYDVLFHKVFYEAADRENAWLFIEQTNAQYERVRMLTLRDFDKLKDLLITHTELFNAIVEGDFETASAITESHISRMFGEIQVLVREYDDFFINKL